MQQSTQDTQSQILLPSDFDLRQDVPPARNSNIILGLAIAALLIGLVAIVLVFLLRPQPLADEDQIATGTAFAGIQNQVAQLASVKPEVQKASVDDLQANYDTLNQENQMLQKRVGELETQLQEIQAVSTGTAQAATAVFVATQAASQQPPIDGSGSGADVTPPTNGQLTPVSVTPSPNPSVAQVTSTPLTSNTPSTPQTPADKPTDTPDPAAINSSQVKAEPTPIAITVSNNLNQPRLRSAPNANADNIIAFADNSTQLVVISIQIEDPNNLQSRAWFEVQLLDADKNPVKGVRFADKNYAMGFIASDSVAGGRAKYDEIAKTMPPSAPVSSSGSTPLPAATVDPASNQNQQPSGVP